MFRMNQNHLTWENQFCVLPLADIHTFTIISNVDVLYIWEHDLSGHSLSYTKWKFLEIIRLFKYMYAMQARSQGVEMLKAAGKVFKKNRFFGKISQNCGVFSTFPCDTPLKIDIFALSLLNFSDRGQFFSFYLNIT